MTTLPITAILACLESGQVISRMSGELRNLHEMTAQKIVFSRTLTLVVTKQHQHGQDQTLLAIRICQQLFRKFVLQAPSHPGQEASLITSLITTYPNAPKMLEVFKLNSFSMKHLSPYPDNPNHGNLDKSRPDSRQKIQ